MGIMSFLQIREEVLHYHANRVDLTTTRLNRLIDLAQYRIARITNWDDLKYTVLGTLTVSAGDTRQDRRNDRLIGLESLIDVGYKFKDLYNFKVVNTDTLENQVLQGLIAKDFDRQFPDPDWYDRRMPTHYMWYGNRNTSATAVIKNTIEMAPAPDMAYEYTMRFQVYPRTISDGTLGDNDASDFSEHDDAIINYVVSQIYQSLGREEKAMEHFRIYGSILQELVREDMANTDNNIIGVKVSDGASSGSYWNDPFVRSVR